MLMHKYEKNLRLLYETPSTIPHAFKPKTEKNRKLIKSIVEKGRFNLTEYEAKKFLANYDIPVGHNFLAKSASQAADVSAKIGFPVAMKVLSPDILDSLFPLDS